ncbi:PucR family transcriptional regulator [Gordonia sp. SL306]|uniref:PucR family transcriptional regulator n=1 Tax=Gordonia sp. SL306 TaxID=2995145 RepID=UPI002271A43B|nr:PucR family transcriptional regulator [Gordonia sp. SL306]WAC54937.1 PucR family transcriptional regulator [Gordonia sp. SL306]
MTVGVPVRWLLGRRELGLQRIAGGAGDDAEITFVVTSELQRPGEWLSGGEAVLTTGIALPPDPGDRRRYVAELAECGAAALGFGLGLKHDEVPAELIEAADEHDLTLFAVPLPTPFVAVAKTITDRLAELQYEAVIVASRAQPRMTRAAVSGGASALIKELSVACAGAVVLLDTQIRVVDTYPADLADDVVGSVIDLVTRDASSAVSSVSSGPFGMVVTQSIRVDKRGHGHLGVVFAHEPRATDQVLIGHANSLLALDFEKPRRLHVQQNRIHAAALRILLSGEADLGMARDVVIAAGDQRDEIRVLTVLDLPPDSDAIVRIVDDALAAATRPVFLVEDDERLLVLLRGSDTVEFADRLFEGVSPPQRRGLRIGLSAAHRVDDLAIAVEQSRMAAASAERRGRAEESTALAGRALLSFPESRRVLDGLAEILVAPVVDHDARNGTELLASVRAYLEANGQWEAAAASLGVHRHTLRGRIARAEEILGCDLSIARVRAELLLAIIARS